MSRRAVVTGATGKIGGAIARGLADAGFALLLPVRDLARARDLPGRALRADLSDHASIEAFAAEVGEPVHLLVNNAAECPPEREETDAGIERQLATNVLGYLWMVRALESALVAGAPSRVVNVASYWAGGLELEDLEFRRRPYDNDAAYRQSKQANRMLSAALAERLAPFGVWVAACHPGDVSSKLSNDLGFGGHESAAQGADTPLFLATAQSPGPSGAYYRDRRATRCEFCADPASVAALYQRLLAY